MLARGGTGLALVLGAALLAVVPSTTAEADAPATCPYTPGAGVYTWTGAVDDSWGVAGNWAPPGVPNDNSTGDATPETSITHVCIGAGENVRLDEEDLSNTTSNQVLLQALYLGPGSTVDVQSGTGLFVNHPTTPSYVAATAKISVFQGSLGGVGTLHSWGDVSIAAGAGSGSSLTSSSLAPGTRPAGTGSLVVEDAGRLDFPNLGVNIQRGYAVELLPGATSVVSGTGAIVANYGTRFEIDPGGVLRLTGPGGYYQGFAETPDLSDLVNDGRVVKSGAGTTSVIDADYQGAGTLEVGSGTVAFPDGTARVAQVSPGQSMSTDQCAYPLPSPPGPCAIATTAQGDPQSASLTVAGSDGGGAQVQVREEGPATATVGPRGLQSTVYAHADGLAPNPADPAVVTMRFDAAQASGSNIDTLAVARQPDGGGAVTWLPSCLGSGQPPAGSTSCVDRRGLAGSSRFAGPDVYVVVRTTTTSRWSIRKELADLIAPTTLTPPQVSGKPKLGRKVAVTATYGESCSVTAKGKVKAKADGRRVKGLELKAPLTQAVAGAQVRVVLKLTKASKRKLKPSGARKGKATISVGCADPAGNAAGPVKLRVKLR